MNEHAEKGSEWWMSRYVVYEERKMGWECAAEQRRFREREIGDIEVMCCRPLVAVQ